MLAYIHPCHEHLSLSIWKSRGIRIAVLTVHCEVIGSAPHSIIAIGDIKALLAFIDHIRLSSSSPMEELFDLSRLIVLLSDFLNFTLEYLPQSTVLNSLNLYDLHLRLSQVEHHLNFFPFSSARVEVLYNDCLLSSDQLMSVFPLRR